MTALSPIDDASRFAPPPQAKSRSDLGQEDFLKLMITQFRNQDPFEPMDNGEFLGQLAQFSTVTGIDSLNSAFAGLAGAIQDEQALQAANLVGRTILARTEQGYLGIDGQLDGAVELDANASDVQIEISDSSGQLLRRFNLGQQPAGIARFTWDGRDATGDRLQPGDYRVSARILRGNEVESASTLIEANIESVTLGRLGQAMTLNLRGGASLSVSQIYQIT